MAHFLFSNQGRLVELVALCGLLWTLESIIPLYRDRGRLGHALPNVGLTARVDVTTAFRQHPGETLWRMAWQLAGTLALGLPLWAVLAYLILSALNAELEHANVRVSARVDRFIRLAFVTPHMHKVHHSRDQRETDSNYSNIFSIWDRLFRTYTPGVDFAALHYGLEGFEGGRAETLRGLLRLPFEA